VSVIAKELKHLVDGGGWLSVAVVGLGHPVSTSST